MKDTLRVIITLDCNLECSYCCNNLPKVKEKFTSIDFRQLKYIIRGYKYVCITGGEPLLKMPLLKRVVGLCDTHYQDLYLYTNGILLAESWGRAEYCQRVFDGINVGLHGSKELMRFILGRLSEHSKMRFAIEDKHLPDMVAEFPEVEFHPWTRDECEMPNEDWVLLKEDL